MRYLLDTNVISELVSKQPNQSVLDWVKDTDENLLYLSVITIGEIKKGIENRLKFRVSRLLLVVRRLKHERVPHRFKFRGRSL